MATSFKARVNKLKSTRVNVSQKSDKSAPETPLSNSMEENTLKAWMHSTNNITNAITRIESDVNSVKSDRDRVIKLEVELEKLMQLISNKDYFKNIFMEMLESMEPEEEKEEEKEKEWKNYIDNELNNLRGILNNTHSNISNSIEEINQNNSKKINFLEEKINKQEIVSELNNFKEVIDIQLKKYSYDLKMVVDGLDARLVTLKQDHTKDTSDIKGELTWINSRLNALKQDHATMVTTQKSFKNDIEILEIFKNKQKKNNELIEENSDNLEKIKKENINFKNRVDTLEKITKETSTIFVTKVADIADLTEYAKKLDGRLGRCENYSKDLGISLGSVKDLFDTEKASLSKLISNLKDDFIELHERCDNTLSTLYRNDTQHIIDKYVFELSQLNLMFESSKTMQRENNYFKCIGNLSSRIDKIEQKIN
jgi:chromosome segregation ATPase